MRSIQNTNNKKPSTYASKRNYSFDVIFRASFISSEISFSPGKTGFSLAALVFLGTGTVNNEYEPVLRLSRLCHI